MSLVAYPVWFSKCEYADNIGYAYITIARDSGNFSSSVENTGIENLGMKGDLADGGTTS